MVCIGTTTLAPSGIVTPFMVIVLEQYRPVLQIYKVATNTYMYGIIIWITLELVDTFSMIPVRSCQDM